MGWACRQDEEIYSGFWRGNLWERDHLEDEEEEGVKCIN
jgi:hypothetical protein